jgi:hypothetical protein
MLVTFAPERWEMKIAFSGYYFQAGNRSGGEKAAAGLIHSSRKRNWHQPDKGSLPFFFLCDGRVATRLS